MRPVWPHPRSKHTDKWFIPDNGKGATLYIYQTKLHYKSRCIKTLLGEPRIFYQTLNLTETDQRQKHQMPTELGGNYSMYETKTEKRKRVSTLGAGQGRDKCLVQQSRELMPLATISESQCV